MLFRSDSQFAAIGRLDIVMVPIDGTYTMSLDGVSEITKRLRSSVVLPMHRFATPLDEFMRLIGQQFEIDRLRPEAYKSYVVECNWKLTMDAFLEVYHFRHIHSHDGVSVLDNRGAAMGLYPHGHSRMITPFSTQQVQRLGMSG